MTFAFTLQLSIRMECHKESISVLDLAKDLRENKSIACNAIVIQTMIRSLHVRNSITRQRFRVQIEIRMMRLSEGLNFLN